MLMQVAGRALGELVRKLGERILPLIIPILSDGLKDPDTSRRQVRFSFSYQIIIIQISFMLLANFLWEYTSGLDFCVLNFCEDLLLRFLPSLVN